MSNIEPRTTRWLVDEIGPAELSAEISSCDIDEPSDNEGSDEV